MSRIKHSLTTLFIGAFILASQAAFLGLVYWLAVTAYDSDWQVLGWGMRALFACTVVAMVITIRKLFISLVSDLFSPEMEW